MEDHPKKKEIMDDKLTRKPKQFALLWSSRDKKHFVILLRNILIKNRIINQVFTFHKNEVKLLAIGGK